MQSAPSRGDTRWQADCVFLLVAIGALLIARIPAIPGRVFDPDELEHAHAAWSVWRGLLPYRDFFEHHSPWYYLALAPFFRWFAVDQSLESARHFLVFARGLSLALTALSALLMFRIGRQQAGRRVGLLAALFLVGLPVVIQKTMEIRPDVPALPFFLAALWFLLRGLGAREASATRGWSSFGWFLAGGLCLGAEIMCTQKALFVLPGALTGLGLWALAGGRRAFLPRSLAVLAVLVGIAVPVLLTWAGFAAAGGGEAFIYNNFIINSRWSLRSSRHLLVTLETSWPILIFAVVGVGVTVVRFARATRRDFADVLLIGTLGGLGVGIAVVPASYKQYYLMPLSIACLYAARGLCFVVDLAAERLRRRLLVGATVLLLIWPVVELGRAFVRRNDAQLALLRTVFERTGPTDVVLGGWLGAQAFRPHPLYYFFMHRELMFALSDAERDAYLGPLESGRVRPALIVLDDELRALGPRFMIILQRNYVTNDGVFYVPARPAASSPAP